MGNCGPPYAQRKNAERVGETRLGHVHEIGEIGLRLVASVKIGLTSRKGKPLEWLSCPYLVESVSIVPLNWETCLERVVWNSIIEPVRTAGMMPFKSVMTKVSRPLYRLGSICCVKFSSVMEKISSEFLFGLLIQLEFPSSY